MRGIAALLVIAHHYRGNLPAQFQPDPYTLFFKSAGSFVDFFFMLSGFVIAYVYLEKSTQTDGPWRPYFRSRFARIYPLHLLTLIWMLVLFIYSGREPVQAILGQMLTNITLTQAWGLHDAYALNFPGWSISGEFAAYLLFPFLAVLFRKTGPWIAVLAVVSCLTIGLHEYLTDAGIAPWERIALLRAIPAFCLGVILYKYRTLPSGLSGTALAALQFFAILALILLMDRDMSLVFLIPVFAVLILSTYEDKGWLSFVLSHAVLYRLGLISYTIYMLHVPVRATGYYVWPKVSGSLAEPWDGILFVAVCTIMTLLLSTVVFRVFEIPMRDKLKRY